MLYGIGNDLIEIERVLKACENPRFIDRVFTEAESALITLDKTKAAGNFAVKEAVVKVFGTGFHSCAPKEIEVLRDAYGKPYVNLYGNAKKAAKERGICRLLVSITNTKAFASAVAVGETFSAHEFDCYRSKVERKSLSTIDFESAKADMGYKDDEICSECRINEENREGNHRAHWS